MPHRIDADGRRRTTIRRRARRECAMLGVAGLFALPGAAAATPSLIDAPASLPAGEAGILRIDASDSARLCSLTAARGRTRQGPFTYRTPRPIVTFRWAIPRRARGGAWTVTVRCAARGRALTRTRPLRVRIAIRGPRGGAARLVEHGSLKTTTTRRTEILGLPSPSPDHVGGGKGGGCASADNGYRSYIDGSTYCTGYCTAYAYGRRPSDDLKYLGDARDWLPNARARGIPTGSAPVAGAIAWWDGRRGGGYGHVAYVERLDGGSVVVAEMNVRGWNQVSSRSIPLGSAAAPHGYIYGGPAGSGSPTGGGGGTAAPAPAGMPDVFFVKTRNTGSGLVEGHTVTFGSGYKTGLSTATRFSPADSSNGWFGVLPSGDVWFVKTKSTGSGAVELHTVTPASGYKTGISTPTRFSPSDANNGWFGVLPNGDVYFVKTKNTGSGAVELHTVTGIAPF